MDLNIDNTVSLGSWIAFQALYGKDLDEWYAEIVAIESPARRSLQEEIFHVERAYSLYTFYHGLAVGKTWDLDLVKQTVPLAEVMTEFYERYGFAFVNNGAELPTFYLQERPPRPERPDTTNELGAFGTGLPVMKDPPPPPAAKPYRWELPPVELLAGSLMTFGQFIDAKNIVQVAREEKYGKWDLIRYVMAIFLRRDSDHYSEEDIRDNSKRLTAIDELPLSVAIAASYWFEQFNTYLDKTFAIFRALGKAGEDKHAKAHFEAWGWVNFLKSIAKTKIFDIVSLGLNSIECARLASCYDVLIYASEEKLYQVAVAADIDAATKKNR